MAFTREVMGCPALLGGLQRSTFVLIRGVSDRPRRGPARQGSAHTSVSALSHEKRRSNSNSWGMTGNTKPQQRDTQYTSSLGHHHWSSDRSFLPTRKTGPMTAQRSTNICKDKQNPVLETAIHKLQLDWRNRVFVNVQLWFVF